MSLALREARLEDLPSLTRIAHAAKRFWGYPERWIRAWREELTLHEEDLRTQEVFVAEDAHGRILGFAALLEVEGRWQLEHLWVNPEFMGQGTGRALFEHAVATVCQQGGTTLDIDSDPHAAEFYRQLGARDCGSTDAPMDGVPRSRPQLRLRIPPD